MPQRSRSHVALGSAIRSARRGRGISQEELAARSGMDRTFVGGIERGEQNPSYEKLLRLAAALGVDASELLRDAESRDRP